MHCRHKTGLVTAKLPFTVDGWPTFGDEVQEYLAAARGRLEDVVLAFNDYFTVSSRKPAVNESTLYSRLSPRLFLLVSDIAGRLNIGMEITDSSGK